MKYRLQEWILFVLVVVATTLSLSEFNSLFGPTVHRNQPVSGHCEKAPSSRGVLDPPQDFTLRMVEGHNQQGSFACGGEANFCLRVRHQEPDALRFRVDELGESGCDIRALALNSWPVDSQRFSIERCFRVHCASGFAGRIRLRAGVHEKNCQEKQQSNGCEDLASQSAGGSQARRNSGPSLDFSLHFLGLEHCRR